MCPSFPVSYVGDNRATNSMSFSFLSIRQRTLPYCDHRDVRQLSVPCFLSVRVSFLCSAILYVIGLCSRKKVLGVYAKRVITFMKNVFSFWDHSNINFPRCLMSLDCFVAWILVSNASVLAHSSPMRCPDPQPASCIWLWGEQFFKSLFNRVVMFPSMSSHKMKATTVDGTCQ